MLFKLHYVNLQLNIIIFVTVTFVGQIFGKKWLDKNSVEQLIVGSNSLDPLVVTYAAGFRPTSAEALTSYFGWFPKLLGRWSSKNLTHLNGKVLQYFLTFCEQK